MSTNQKDQAATTYLVLSLAGLASYFLIWRFFWKNRSTLRQPFYLLLLNLSVADNLALLQVILYEVPVTYAASQIFGIGLGRLKSIK